MKTILKACLVPWAVSPSSSGLTLTHSESDESPECTVTFGGGRIQSNGLTDSRRIELKFDGAYLARLGPHSDSEGIEAIGYRITDGFTGPMSTYLAWRNDQWHQSGMCPDPGFYVAIQSDWMGSMSPTLGGTLRHYVIDGRNGYVEVIAEGYSWCEWLWEAGERDSWILNAEVAAWGQSDN